MFLSPCVCVCGCIDVCIDGLRVGMPAVSKRPLRGFGRLFLSLSRLPSLPLDGIILGILNILECCCCISLCLISGPFFPPMLLVSVADKKNNGLFYYSFYLLSYLHSLLHLSSQFLLLSYYQLSYNVFENLVL